VSNVDPDKIIPHALRHTFCTAVALHTKGGIKRVQALAGHADLRTSARHVDVDIDDAAAMVGAVWS
jgi:integrase